MKRECKRGLSSAVAIGLELVFLLLSTLSLANAANTDHIRLSGSGNSMYPTIAAGDTVTVQMPVDPDSIKIGDIIVYGSIAALAYIPNPPAMWIAHRVVDKYQTNGHWCFRTKGDNNTYVDPWEVPDYWVTGIVVGIEHSMSTSTGTSTARPAQTQQSSPVGSETDLTWLSIIIGLMLGATCILKQLSNSGTSALPRKPSTQTCSRCRYYQTEYIYMLQMVDERLGIRKTVDPSRGFCQHYNEAVVEGLSKRKFRKYEA